MATDPAGPTRTWPKAAGRRFLASPAAERGTLWKASEVVLSACFLMFARMWWSLKTKGSEKVPPDTPVIYAANHSSFADSFLLSCTLDRRQRANLRYLMGRDYFDGMGWLAQMFLRFVEHMGNTIPLDRNQKIRVPMEQALECLRVGRSVVIFPSGQRSHDGTILPFKSALGWIVVKARVPVVPVLIRGSEQALGKGQPYPRRANVAVDFLDPISPEDLIRRGRANPGKGSYFSRIARVVEARLREVALEGPPGRE